MVKPTTRVIMFLFVIFVMDMCIEAVSAQSDTCQSCNCQFNNVQVLDQLIQDKIATALENTGTLIKHQNISIITVHMIT